MKQTTIKIGKRGNIVLPAELRKQFGLAAGTELVVEATNSGIWLRPATGSSDGVPVWSAEETAYYILMNARTQEDWDASLSRVLELGIDPAGIPGVTPDRRDTLPAREQWEASEGQLRAARLEALHRP